MRHLKVWACFVALAAVFPAAAQDSRGLRGALQDEARGRSADLGTIRSLLRGHTDRHEEGAIITILGKKSDADLDALVRALDLNDLFSSVDDRLFGPDNRTRLLDLLARKRLAALSVPARAAMVDALQRGHTDGLDERTIEAILRGTHGRDLTRLKNLIDVGGDHRDLLDLVEEDIDDAGRRRRILDHIAAEACPTGETRLLSDVDDTFYSSLKDARYPKGTRYPGVLQFHRELGGDHVVFLTARPQTRAGLVEDYSLAKLREKGVGPAAMLCGDLFSLVSHARMANKKLENFDAYRRLFPEYGYAFVGDSGQGDPMLARQLLAERAQYTRAAFIHNVTDMSDARRQEMESSGIAVFDTYLGAAVRAYQKGLIDAAGLQRIAEAAARDLEEIEFDSPQQREARRADLRRDMDRVDALLGLASAR